MLTLKISEVLCNLTLDLPWDRFVFLRLFYAAHILIYTSANVDHNIYVMRMYIYYMCVVGGVWPTRSCTFFISICGLCGISSFYVRQSISQYYCRFHVYHIYL